MGLLLRFLTVVVALAKPNQDILWLNSPSMKEKEKEKKHKIKQLGDHKSKNEAF